MAIAKDEDPKTNNLSERTIEKRLIILDLNGVLCRRVYLPELKSFGQGLEEYQFFDQSHHRVFLRPHMETFLEECFDLADVAIWSSTTYHNAEPLIRRFFTTTQYQKLLFKWYRDRTRLDPDYRRDPEVKKSDTIKNIFDVIQSPIINTHRQYGYDNIVICDDDPRKIRFNPDINVVHIPSFDPRVKYEPEIVSDVLQEIEARFGDQKRLLTDSDHN